MLLEDGELVTVWRESDAPGLAHWLRLLLARYHGAWHVAQKPLKSLPAQRKAARDTAEKKKGHGAKEAAIRAEMEAIKAKKKNPKYAMKENAQSVGCDVSYARRVFRKIAGQ